MFKKLAGFLTKTAVVQVVEAISIDLSKVAERIVEVESWIRAPNTGPQKKALVINYVLDTVDIPYVPENVERQIWSLVIDGLVAVFNRYGIPYVWKKKAAGGETA